MRLLDKFLEDRFRVLRDGRTVFMPSGAGGPIYLIPDEATRKQFEGFLKVGGLLGSALFFGVAKLIYQDGVINWGWAALMLAYPFWTWWVARRAAETLQEVHDASVFNPPTTRSAEFGGATLWVRAVGALVCLVAGLAISVQHPSAWMRWVGLAVAFAAALTIPITIQEIERKREIESRDHERAGGWFDDSAYARRRRFF